MELRFFSEIDLNDNFFDSLKKDYDGFEDWYKRKAVKNELVFVQFDEEKHLQGFLYLKDETDQIDNSIKPIMNSKRRFKVGTFKIDAHNTRLGERFIKKIMDKGIYEGYEEAYVTIFPKQEPLILLLQKYGFKEYGTKGEELVLVKDFTTCEGNILKDYPLIQPSGKRKFLLSIYPRYHTPLFSDSILKNEERRSDELVKDVSFSNSIHKVYICFMPKTAYLRKGDLLVIYRTNDNIGPARYRSVVTSICQVEELKVKSDFANINEYIGYCKKYSIFEENDLRIWYRKDNLVVIKMTYNIALAKRVTRGMLVDEAKISPYLYWGFFQLTDSQFNYILDKGEVNENFIVD